MKVSTLQVLSNTDLLAKALQRRGLKMTVSGKVWSQELEAYVSGAEAYLAGLGKTRQSGDERFVFNLLLIRAAEQALKHWHPMHEDQEDKDRQVLDLFTKQGRMEEIMKLIEIQDPFVDQLWKENQYAGYIYKILHTPPAERTAKQLRAWHHPNNQLFKNALRYKEFLWSCWNTLKASSDKLAEDGNLWPLYFGVNRTSFTIYGEDRTAQEYKGTFVHTTTHKRSRWELENGVAVERHYETLVIIVSSHVEYPEEDELNGLTGHWDNDLGDHLAKSYLQEQRRLQIAEKALEYHKKQRWYKRPTKTQIQKDIAWVKAERRKAYAKRPDVKED